MSEQQQLERDIRKKLMHVFANEIEEVYRVLFYIRDQDQRVTQQNQKSPFWNSLDALYETSQEKFKEHAQRLANKTRYDQDIEERYKQFLLNELVEKEKLSPRTQSSSLQRWKNDIRLKIVDVLHDKPEQFARVLFYLEEEDKKHPNQQTAPVWNVLRSAYHGPDEAFQTYIYTLVEETLSAQTDEHFKSVMNTIYKGMLNATETCSNSGQKFELDGKQLIRKLSNVTDAVGVDERQKMIKCLPTVAKIGFGKALAVSNFDRTIRKIPKQDIGFTVLGLSVVYLSVSVFTDVYRWWQGDISGKRCSKNIIDASGKIGGALTGGYAGAHIGGVLGPIGSIVGVAFGSVLGLVGAGSIIDRWTQTLFDLPKDEALERAYKYMGVTCKATNNEVNRAFRNLCLQHHPDKGGDPMEFQKLQTYMALIKASRGEKPKSSEQKYMIRDRVRRDENK